MCPGGDHAVGFEICRSAKCRGALDSNGLRYSCSHQSCRSVHGPLNICMPLLFMCFWCMNEGALACMAAVTPSRSSPALSLAFLMICTLAVRFCERGAFLTASHWWWIRVPGMQKAHAPVPALSPAASRSAYQLLWGGKSPRLFLFCGLCRVVIILSWQTFPSKHTTKVHKVQV